MPMVSRSIEGFSDRLKGSAGVCDTETTRATSERGGRGNEKKSTRNPSEPAAFPLGGSRSVIYMQ